MKPVKPDTMNAQDACRPLERPGRLGLAQAHGQALQTDHF